MENSKKTESAPTRKLSELKTIGDRVVWLEQTVTEGVKSARLTSWRDGIIEALTPENVVIGSRVQEYGGGSWQGRIAKNETLELVFAFGTQVGLSRRTVSDEKSFEILVPEKGSESFYADFEFCDALNGILAVRETRSKNGEETSALVLIPYDGGEVEIIADNADFYAFPRVCGNHLTWIEWPRTTMPWWGSRLVLNEIASDGSVRFLKSQEGCTEPRFDEKGDLYFLCDAQGENDLVRLSLPSCAESVLVRAPYELGLPLWQLGQDSYIVSRNASGAEDILARSSVEGNHALLRFNGKDWREIKGVNPVFAPNPLENGAWAALNAPSDRPLEIVIFRIEGDKALITETIRRSGDGVGHAPQYLKISDQGVDAGLNALYWAPEGVTELKDAPMIVRVHGGPTAQAMGAYDEDVLFWTRRGFAVLDVNYRGSIGQGNAYRDALNGLWGVADVNDCIKATRFVQEKGLASPDKCFIRGSSAGGLTVLNALAREGVIFKGGCARYGVSDLNDLVRAAFRFEESYLGYLVGDPEKDASRYKARSPVGYCEKISAPVLLLHGKKDRVVPYAQTEALYEKLKRSKLVAYENKGHGFRDPSARRDALEQELNFYRDIIAQN